jgi:tetratricopeptide (TPR) repeat protein
MKQGIRLEALLAFCFGVVFCSVLAYAGLRSTPISDPGQFFILRVLSALSAAGVAAVIPGMLDLQLKTGPMLIIRGSGALGVFLVVFLTNPPQLIQGQIETEIQSMYANYSQGLYGDADRAADKVLKINANEDRAWNVKGGIAFYQGKYDLAVEFFTKCTELKPHEHVYQTNLGAALVELGAPLKAIDAYQKANDGTQDWYFAIGRAQFYAGRYDEALSNLQVVGGAQLHGAARLLEAATLLQISKAKPPESREALLNESTDHLAKALNADRPYWAKIFSGNRDIHVDFDYPVQILMEQYVTLSSSRSAHAP